MDSSALVLPQNLCAITLNDTNGSQDKLDIPFRLEPSVVESTEKKLALIERTVRTNPKSTLWQLFALVEPILALHYQAIKTDKQDLFACYREVCKGEPIEDTLQEELRKITDGQTSLDQILQAIDVQESDFITNPIQLLNEAIQQYYAERVNLASYQGDRLWEYLRFIATNFPFITQLRFGSKVTPKQIPDNPDNLLKLAVLELKDPDITALLLRAGADPNKLDDPDAKRTLLHLAVKKNFTANGEPIPPALFVVKALLECPRTERHVYCGQGYPALFLADTRFTELFTLFIEYGFNIDHPDSTGETLIERAIMRNDVATFVELVKRGGGKIIQFHIFDKLLLMFKKSYMEPGFSEAWKLLLQQNYQVAIRFDFTTLSLNQPSSLTKDIRLQPTHKSLYIEAVTLDDTKPLLICLPKTIKLFDERGQLVRHNATGRSVVSHVESRDNNYYADMHVKKLPELPINHMAACLLERELFQQNILFSTCALVRMIDSQGQVYSALWSHTAAGENLLNIVKEKPAELHKLDHRSFTIGYLMELVAVSIDKKPDNCKFNEFINSKGKLAKKITDIDCEQTFFPCAVTEKDGKPDLQLKSILLLLNMLEPLDKDECERFVKLDPEEHLRNWAQSVGRIQKLVDGVFSEPERTKLAENKSTLAFSWKPGLLVNMLARIKRIQAVLAKQLNKNVMLSGLQTLRQVEPFVWIIMKQRLCAIKLLIQDFSFYLKINMKIKKYKIPKYYIMTHGSMEQLC